ncbi:MarR family transcriptional regulator [Arthrobacter livingstonensis]|uniref:MarR family transcriptional regulator n=1 Tax=Arthrobacter livingstonensis TaxID=670078 RepID=A0A2V5LM55_9MICC|nr:MarR family transcriptional regulator [Arthrobacter livingstonensis]PYI68670.1 MarR family transcriptional regulator [Arthrobacter livingstonensis]
MSTASPLPGKSRTAAVATELRTVIGTLRRRMNQGRSPGDFTPSQIAVLVRLQNDGPATVTSLARAEGVRPQSMGATVSVLDAAGLIGGSPDPTDRRQTILSLTDFARESFNTLRAAKESWLVRAIETELTPAEQEQLAAGVALLTRLANS